MQNAKRFITLYLTIILLLFVVPIALGYILLQRAGENESFHQIINRQLSENAIYGSALTENSYIYKQEMVRRLKPDVIALGSSRVMQFRQEFFNTSFVNCGLAMRSLHEGRVFITEMLRFHKPKVIILGLDFWWFRENHHSLTEDDIALAKASVMPERLTVPKLIMPYKFMMKKKLKFDDLMHILLAPDSPNQVSRYENIGILAMKGKNGFRKDGSHFYPGQTFGLDKKFYDVHFKNTLYRVESGTARFVYGQDISAERVREFQEILKLCKQNGIPVVLFVSPVAPPVYQAMRAKQHHEYDYIEAFQNIVAKAPDEHYDYLNPDDLQTNSCEFYDGYHGGDVTYARILRNIAGTNPHSAIVPYLKKDALDQVVKQYDGFAMIPFHSADYPLREVDFLKIGCKKRQQ